MKRRSYKKGSRKLTLQEAEMLSDELDYLQDLGPDPLDTALKYAQMILGHLKRLGLPKTRIKPIENALKRAERKWPDYVWDAPLDDYSPETLEARESALQALMEPVLRQLQTGVDHLAGRHGGR